VAELNGLGHVAEMREGEKSQYDIVADGKTIFSKQREGRYPELPELIALLPSAGG
jgi:predicted Rdx family selenoprotein